MLEGKPVRVDEAATLRAIRDILSDYEGDLSPAAPLRRPPAGQAPAQPDSPDPTLQPVREIDAKLRPARFTTVPGTEAATKTAPPPLGTARAQRKHRTPPAAPRRLSPRWAAIAVLLACAILYPALVVLPLFAGLFGLVGAFVLFGPERVWDALARALARLEARNPRKAARAMRRLDAVAVRLDAVLDRCPERWVAGLYMPDFANRAARAGDAEARTDARLDRMHRQV